MASDTQFDSNVATATFVIKFVNQYPASTNPVSMYTNDTKPLDFTLTASDHEGDSFFFYITSFIPYGTLTDLCMEKKREEGVESRG